MTPQGTTPDPLCCCTGFELLDPIDRGGSGIVWRARGAPDCPLPILRGEIVAIKVLERSELVRMPEHPALVRLHHVTDDDPPCAVMEWVYGRTMRRWFEEMSGRDPADRLEPALRIFHGVLAGLEALHDEGLVHGDIKPENLLVAWDPAGEDDGVRIVDLPYQAGPVRFTPYYAAAEQLYREPFATRASDVFSTGLVLAEAILGVPAVPHVSGPGRPLEKALLALGRFDPDAVARRVGDVCTQLEPVLRKALALDPARRLDDAGVFRGRVTEILRWLAAKDRTRGHRFLVLAQDRVTGSRLRDALQERGHRAEIAGELLAALDDWMGSEVVVLVLSQEVRAEHVESLLRTRPPRPLVVVGSGLSEAVRIAILEGGGGLVEGHGTESVVCLAAEHVLARLRAGLLAEKVHHLTRTVGIDPGSGLQTRHAFERRTQRLVERHVPGRSGSTHHVFVLDVDGFRQFEEEQGREIAENLLARVADLIRGVRRTGDALARDDFHPDRFLLLGARTGPRQARTIAARYEKAIRGLEVRDRDGNRLEVSWSIGVAAIREGGESAEELVLRAEDRMRRAKKEGAGTICWGDGAEEFQVSKPGDPEPSESSTGADRVVDPQRQSPDSTNPARK